MEYQYAMSRLVDMESRFKDGFSSTDRDLLEQLNQLLFGRNITNKGCSDCYRDAYLVIRNKLKQDKKMPIKPNYELKGGVLLHEAGSPRYYTNPIEDEVAEDYLGKYPNQITLFANYPHDWEERVEKRKRGALISPVEELPTEVTALQEEISKCNATIAEAIESMKLLEAEKTSLQEALNEATEEKHELAKKLDEAFAQIEELSESTSTDGEATASDDVAALQMENETLKADLESAKEEIATLKSENRALKAANTRLKKGQADAQEQEE